VVSGPFTVPVLWADPSDNVTPDNPLYQRVKKLGDYGLLDSQDKAVLDDGLVVTRLELAFYTEKAKARITAPQYTPTVPLSAPAPVPTTPPPASQPPVSIPAALPTFTPVPVRPVPTATPIPVLQPAAPAPSLPAPLAQPAPSKGDLQSEIDELLKELHQESEVLRNRVSLDDYRVEQQQAELDKLKDVQDELDATFRKANKSGGVPHFNSISDIRVENVHVSGLTQVSASAIKNEVNLGVWSDLGGKGSISLGLGSYLYSSASDTPSSPASIYLFSPTVNWSMDGQLGHWDNHIAVEAYTSDTSLGDFTRGTPLSNLRYEEPFEIKRYSTDKNMKNWDDYMTNLGYVPSSTSWSSQSSTGIVFDGFYMLGSHLPLVSSDAKATILVGRMGRSNTYQPEEQRLEEGLKYSQPWLNGLLQTSFTGYWNNEDFGITPAGTPAMDSQNYEADLGFDLRPFFLSLKGGYSQFYTGIDTNNPTNPTPLEAPAGQASLSFYPLTVYYTAISDTYSNSQGSVYQAGFKYNRFGYTGGSYSYNNVTFSGGVTGQTGPDYQYGFIGMVDDLISDRYGWRANLGWKGRQSDWMKDWPSILDDLIINFDVAQTSEYTVIPDESGHNVIESYQLVTVYYPDDTGMWGSNIWGGYGGYHPMGQAYAGNIAAARNDGTSDFYLTQLGVDYMQRIPFMLPVYSAGVIQQSGGHNVYTQLDHLKTFNYITLTTKLQLNKMLGMAEPFYGSFFFTDHQVSGTTTNPALVNMPDPNRPGATLANIPNLFNQTVYDIAGLYQVAKNLNVLADYGLEFWTSNYTYPVVNWRTDSYGLGLAYDLPWGGGKFELRYKHLNYQDYSVVLNDYQADQVYSYFLFQF